MLQDISIDTLYLVANVTNQEFEGIKSLFNMKKQSNYSEYKTTHIDNNSLVPYSIKYNPIDIYQRPNITKIMRTHWNIKIELQHKTLMDLPQNIRLLLQRYDWRINQIEIAFDFNTPISNHFSYISNKTQVRNEHIDSEGNIINYGQNYYIYSNSSPQQALVYDKKKQMSDIHDVELNCYKYSNFDHN